MFKKMSLRFRLTLMTAFLITVCCVGLTLVLNFSANRLANSIDAVLTTPAQDGEVGTFPMIPLAPSREVQEAKQGYRIESVLYMVFATMIGSALTYFIVGCALKPVKRLNRQVKTRTINNLSEHLEVPPTKDEIAQLTVSFNELTDQLHENFEIEQRFSANVAHELRTPLTVLQTKIDVFYKKEQHTLEEYEFLMTSVKKQTTKLRELIKSLLDMTNMEDMTKQEVSLDYLFLDIFEELSYLAEQKKVTMSLQCHQKKMIGNTDLLYRAFYNLIENAMKYNIYGGTVQVEITSDNLTKIDILIKDSGIGIPSNLRKHVFEPFYQVNQSSSETGLGLGLAMVDNIIKKHEGTIHITDLETPGTCFKITFFHQNSKSQ